MLHFLFCSLTFATIAVASSHVTANEQAQATVSLKIGSTTALFRRITPKHYKVDYPIYYVLETEVTNEMYREYLMATGKDKDDSRVAKIVRDARDLPVIEDGRSRTVVFDEEYMANLHLNVVDEATLWKRDKYPKGLGQHPVGLITVREAEAFCDWLSAQYPERGVFRLPTWNEWMLAAYGSDRKYPWGNEWQSSRARCSYEAGKTTEPVKARVSGRTPEGLFGMIGNVGEYVASDDRSNKEFFQMGSRCMGGGFNSGRTLPRKDYWGYRHRRDARNDALGFRIVLDPSKNKKLLLHPPLFTPRENAWGKGNEQGEDDDTSA